MMNNEKIIFIDNLHEKLKKLDKNGEDKNKLLLIINYIKSYLNNANKYRIN